MEKKRGTGRDHMKVPAFSNSIDNNNRGTGLRIEYIAHAQIACINQIAGDT